MSLPPGTRIGCYEVGAQIGAGGMGEVYRARDTKLRRDVALKILPTIFVSDPDRRARFAREAQVLASLNHPNIAAIYGSEETADVAALAMELVEGETLADRLERGALPMDEALAIARQFAEALEAAHDQWSRDGREIFYRSATSLMAVQVRTEPAFKVVSSTPLFNLAGYVLAGSRGLKYDVARDGRFLMLKSDTVGDAASRQDIVVVQNWLEELRQKVTAR